MSHAHPGQPGSFFADVWNSLIASVECFPCCKNLAENARCWNGPAGWRTPLETNSKPGKPDLLQNLLETARRLKLAAVIRVSVDDSRGKQDRARRHLEGMEYEVDRIWKGASPRKPTGIGRPLLGWRVGIIQQVQVAIAA